MEYIHTPAKIDDLRVGEKVFVTRGTLTKYMGEVIDKKDDKVLIQPISQGYFIGWFNYKTSFYRVIKADDFNDHLTKLSQL